MSRHLRHAVRTLRERPGSSLAIVLTLGIAMGAATALFDFVNVFYWQVPPIERPEEVVGIHTASVHAFIGPYGLTSYPDFETYREASGAFTGLVGFLPEQATLDDGETVEVADAWLVSGDYFEVLGVGAAAGRLLTTEDDAPGRPPVAVLSHALWRRLGGSDDVLGESFRLGGTFVTVVGVAPEEFGGTMSGTKADLFVPAHLAPALLDPGTGWLTDSTLQRWNLLGRLRPGVDRGAAEAELARHARELDRLSPLPDLERRISVVPARMGHPVDRMRAAGTVRVFGVAVALLLLIACANVANLYFARAAGRRGEIAVRRALGASRGRLVGQLLAESSVLAVLGGLFGLLVAVWSRRLLALLLGPELVADMRFDYRVLGLSLVVCLVVTLLSGLVPALTTSRVDLTTPLRGGRSADPGRRLAAGPLLAAAQIALSLVLASATLHLVRDLAALQSADLGISTEHRLRAGIDLSQARYDPGEGRAVLHRIAERTRALPGVEAAGFGLLVPPVLLEAETRFRLPGAPDDVRSSRFDTAGPGYFGALGLTVLRGRGFERRDGELGHGVVVVNQALAEELWPGEDALGRRILVERHRPGEPGPEYEVVGVVASSSQFVRATGPEPILYFSLDQRHRSTIALVLRAGGAPGATFAALRRTLREIDPRLALTATTTLEEHRREALVIERFHVRTVGAFGLVGLFLALLGVFAVTGYGVSRRRAEIGIRMALGAHRRDVLAWVLRGSLAVGLGGIALGLLASFWALQGLRHYLPELGAADPLVLLAVAAALLVCTLAAALLPARRASLIDPRTALEGE